MTANVALPPATPVAEIPALASAARNTVSEHQRHPTFSPSALLRAVATQLEGARANLVAAAQQETSLPEARLQGELTRTTRQLVAFAQLAESGLESDAIIDLADPAAEPPRPDQRRLAVPIGPVAVFAASNFPFAFSVAGGDTAAAWAAGCPVLLKAHAAHTRTSVLTATAVAQGLADAGAPKAWFTMVYGASPEVGQALVNADSVEAVAFTGSFGAGTAIARAAAARPRPIPAFCEMGSTNPVVITPASAQNNGKAIAAGLATSITGSVGQLCTKPGLILLVDDEAGRQLVAELSGRIAENAPATMLYRDIRDRFVSAVIEAADDPRVDALVAHPSASASGQASAALLATATKELAPGDVLLEEIFGPASLVIWAEDESDLVHSVEKLPGTLTATLHASPADPLAGPLLHALSARAGRIVYNGYPTGVTVGHATVHGGPFPATTAAAHTSVGMTAIRRFQRPLGYQDVPDELLPPALRDANPLGLQRRVDGAITAASVTRVR
ncbi:MAG TPA: aldehyde dehydrogenase family protein [Solirubrobacteraceae bacterium]|jgi:NADP-dependent aldehyde dehydrogenase|nr:aldehyde dehydrogenase family protein [Solirubrobacteraceae bacterium]